MSRILLHVADGVAKVTLNNPDHKNAIDDGMRSEFPQILDRLAEDDAIRVIVITGAGDAFSAGGSVELFEQDWNPRAFRRQSHHLSGIFNELEFLEKPIIAALNGVATGAGLQLALACDLRFAADTARLGYREHHLGLIPSHGGATRLVKLIGLSHAKDLYFRGDLVTADEAYRMGLIHRVLPAADLESAALAEADKLAQRAPASLGMTKRLLNTAANVDVASGLALESFAQSLAIQTEDHREGIRAFREKRRPEFRGE